MSVYAPHFNEPIVKREEQQRLKEENSFKDLAHKEFKAARVDVTSSTLQDPVVSKFINYIMEGGKKELARRVLEKGFQNIKRSQLER